MSQTAAKSQQLTPAPEAEKLMQLDVQVRQKGTARSRLSCWPEGLMQDVNWMYRAVGKLQRWQQPCAGYDMYLSSCGGPATVKRKRPRLCTHSGGAGCRDGGSGDKR